MKTDCSYTFKTSLRHSRGVGDRDASEGAELRVKWLPRAEEVFRRHVGTGDRADHTGYLRGTVKDARKMVGEFRNGPYDWDVLEAFAAEIVRAR